MRHCYMERIVRVFIEKFLIFLCLREDIRHELCKVRFHIVKENGGFWQRIILEHEESDNIFRKTLWLKKMELIIERILNFPNTLSHKFSESEHIVNQLSGFYTRWMFTKARHMPFH